MLTASLLNADNLFVGVLRYDLTFTAEKTCTISKVSFDRGSRHLFVTEFDVSRHLSPGDTMRVNLDSGIGFYFLATCLQEPFISAQRTMELWRGLRQITEKIRHERQARNQLSTWDKQIYEVLFHEKQQPVPWGDSGLLVQRDYR